MDPLPVEALRWRCDPDEFAFETTADIAPPNGLVGQDAAVEALRFGLATDAPGQHIFIRGLSGTGRMRLVRRLLEGLSPECRAKQDRCYVHDFKRPERPRLLTLPPGRARAFRRQVQELAEFIRDDFAAALESEALKSRREALERREKAEVEAITGPFETSLKEADLALVSVQIGPVSQTASTRRSPSAKPLCQRGGGWPF